MQVANFLESHPPLIRAQFGIAVSLSRPIDRTSADVQRKRPVRCLLYYKNQGKSEELVLLGKDIREDLCRSILCPFVSDLYQILLMKQV